MNLIESAKRMHETGVVDPLAMPQIVAALEAAERVAKKSLVAPQGEHASLYWLCVACDEETLDQYPDDLDSVPIVFEHTPDCPWQALVAALRGEKVTA